MTSDSKQRYVVFFFCLQYQIVLETVHGTANTVLGDRLIVKAGENPLDPKGYGSKTVFLPKGMVETSSWNNPQVGSVGWGWGGDQLLEQPSGRQRK